MSAEDRAREDLSTEAAGAAFYRRAGEFMRGEDRPGDRDQQQAAEIVRVVDRRLTADQWGSAYRVVAASLAAARAEEAARWQAKIKALAVEFVSEAQKAAASTDPELANPYINAALRLRALLDGEQR